MKNSEKYKSPKPAPMANLGKEQTIDDLNPSAGSFTKGNYKPMKTSGIKIRGTGAATKGTMARGPMA